MACTLPVIATAVGGSPEIVEDNVSGVLIPPANAPAISRAVVGLLDHPDKAARLATAARKRVLDHFTLDRMVDANLTLYQRLLASEK
jgi:glycosyltransferase involved in cell wall biosynthesis